MPGSIIGSLAACRSALIAVVVFSFSASLLQFVVPLYMLQIYDRVITSRNESTLLALSLVAAFLLLIYAALEALRARILVRAGLLFDRHVAGTVFDAVHRARAPAAAGGQTLRDVDTLREFITGPGFIAFCDAPWFPIFIAAAFLLHPLYGWVALTGSTVIVALTVLNELITRRQLAEAGRASIAALQKSQSTLRNLEVLQAMGMLAAIRGVWTRAHEEQLRCQARASDRAGVLVAATRCARLLLQIAILGTGAFLAVRREVSPGSIVAASILIGRALQPVEVLVTQWKGFVAARAALRRVREVLALPAPASQPLALPPPSGALALEDVTVMAPGTAPGGERAILRRISLAVAAGEILAIVGPSAAGKSTLVRAVAGVWPAATGKIRLDGYDIGHWDPQTLGRHIGYLPQTVDLFTGSVAENIARFQDADPGLVIEAARAAGCHEMVQQLADGYNTQIGDGGRDLSGGQRQRIGLARALYGAPQIVLLDEPNAHLDTIGEQALAEALAGLRRRGATTLIVSHAPGILAAADTVLLLRDGAVQAWGPRKDMLAPQPVAAAH